MVSSLVLWMYVSVDWAPLSSITDLWLVRWYFGCMCQWIGLLSVTFSVAYYTCVRGILIDMIGYLRHIGSV